MKNYLIVTLLLFNTSCQMGNNKEYLEYQILDEFYQIEDSKEFVKYQTFDEYKLMGVGLIDIKEPYVLVKKELDTISIIRSTDSEKVIKYINKKGYWYSKSIIYVDTIKGTKQRLTPTVYEKFIFNDTVIEYKYLLENNLERWMQRIYIHTKKDCIILSIQNDDIQNHDDPYNEIREFVTNYKEIFPLYSPGYQPRCYFMFEKQLKEDVLSIYEIEGKNKSFVSSKEMNSLGEFDHKGTMAWWW